MDERLAVQVKALEMQLAVLKCRMKHMSTSTSSRSFSDLYGSLRGKVNSSEEEIDAAQYGFEWESGEEGTGE